MGELVEVRKKARPTRKEIREGAVKPPPPAPVRAPGMGRGSKLAIAAGVGAAAASGALVAQRRKSDVGKAFATRDQDSSIGTSRQLKKPQGDGLKATTTAQTRSGSFAGKTRGVGRKAKVDENSSPGSTRVRTPRGPSGKFVSHEAKVQIFHPIGGSKRGSVHTKQLFRGKKTPSLLSKAEPVRKGMTPPMDTLAVSSGMGAGRGRRLV